MRVSPDAERRNKAFHSAYQARLRVENDFAAEVHLVEGPLLKYRPGFTADYINRWCRVSERYFYYYKDQHTSML